FQAEDGIRDRNVTGVQTCALPILEGFSVSTPEGAEPGATKRPIVRNRDQVWRDLVGSRAWGMGAPGVGAGRRGRSGLLADPSGREGPGAQQLPHPGAVLGVEIRI